jgi:C3 family ADP-ribosyltransferase
MTTALALDTNRLRRTSNLLTEPAFRKMVSLPADLAEDIASLKSHGREGPGVLDTEFDPGTVGGDFEYLEVANEWARRFYEAWIKTISLEEYLALVEYKKEGFRSLNRGLRNHDGDLSMLPPADRRRAEGLDAALEKSPPLERPMVVYRGRLPDAVLEAFEAGEEETLLDQVFGDLAYTSTSLASGIAREYGGSSRFPDSVGKITLPRGTKAGYVDAVFDKGQYELLLPRETRFRIDRVYREYGVYRIEGQLVPW